MSLVFQCPKSKGSNFVVLSKTFAYTVASFLWWTWVKAIHTGYIVRCTDHACGRIWRIGVDGVHEPAGSRAQIDTGPVSTEKDDTRDREREREREADPLGAVRRVEV